VLHVLLVITSKNHHGLQLFFILHHRIFGDGQKGEACWNKRGSDMTQLSFDDNKGINIQ
jgi:hypothetical protein